MTCMVISRNGCKVKLYFGKIVSKFFFLIWNSNNPLKSLLRSYIIHRSPHPDYIFQNIKAFKNSSNFWENGIKPFIDSQCMTQTEKEEIVKNAKIEFDSILAKNNLKLPYYVEIFPFDAQNEYYFTTEARYVCESVFFGQILIELNSTRIRNNVGIILFQFLHEYSHGIYEVGMHARFGFNTEIEKLKKYSCLVPYPTEVVNDDGGLEKDQFCELFPYYLMKIVEIDILTRKLTEKERIEIDMVCDEILKKINLFEDYIIQFKKNCFKPNIL